MYSCHYLIVLNPRVADTACYGLELLTQICHRAVQNFTIPDVDTFRKFRSSYI